LGDGLRVASFNVLNYFNGDGIGGGFPTARGADTPAEFARQQAKIVAAMVGLNADVMGLLEIENDGFGPTSAIQSLVNALNAATAPGTYAFINPGVGPIGGDQITVGMIYKPSAVTPVGAAAILDSSFVDPDGGGGFNSAVQRPSVAQTFMVNATGAVFTPVINHLKSKGSSAGGVGDNDAFDGQGFSNGTRTRAADTLMDWLATDPTGSADPDFLILGDLNAYAMEDPLGKIRIGADNVAGTADDFVSLVDATGYSFSFDGQFGSLDHALASSNLRGQVVGAADWHINADEPTVLDYNVEFKSAAQQLSLFAPDAYRASDHDPILVVLNLGRSLTGGTGADTLNGTTGNDQINGGAGRDTINGGAGNDIIIGGAGRDLLTGGPGADVFVYNSLLDAGDVVRDFVKGEDRLDISTLLASVGYTGSDPVGAGYLSVSLSAGRLLVNFDADGSAGAGVPRLLVELTGISSIDPHQLLDPGWMLPV
jgi:uncharacterized protein